MEVYNYITKENNANREYKASLFHLIFHEKKDALELYNAINHSTYDNPEELVFTTLEDVIYIGMKNDLSFLIGNTLNLYEHQSTWNPNMPLRGFLYFARLYQNYVDENDLDMYSSTLLKLPVPQFVVFYNGTKEQEDRTVLHLSDSFPIGAKQKSCLECDALMLNINIGHNKELLEHCRKLNEYAIFIGKVRENTANGMKLKAAIDLAVDECIKEDVLADLLRKNRAEVCSMVWWEYDEEKHIKNEKQITEEETEQRILSVTIRKAINAGKSKETILQELIEDYEIPKERAEYYFEKVTTIF